MTVSKGSAGPADLRPNPVPPDGREPTMKTLREVARRLSVSRPGASHEMVAGVVREAIVSGLLKAGQPLPQHELAAELEVSHIPVREALRQLQSEGLVSYQANHGVVVASLDAAEVREIYEIRIVLESAALSWAVPKVSEAVLAKAAGLLDAAEHATDGREWGRLDVEFHDLIYCLDDRPRMHELIAGYLRRVDRYWNALGLMLKHRAAFDADHRAILGAVASRDAGEAVRLLDGHLSRAAELLAAELEAPRS